MARNRMASQISRITGSKDKGGRVERPDRKDTYMNRNCEYYFETSNDEESLNKINETIKKYPTDKGYRIETFMSPKFVRITVYKMGE